MDWLSVLSVSGLFNWHDVPEYCAVALKVLLLHPKNHIPYNLKANPSQYLRATITLCREMGPEVCEFSPSDQVKLCAMPHKILYRILGTDSTEVHNYV